jgi:PadR family transcriptional regulator, regulatory protein PadR
MNFDRAELRSNKMSQKATVPQISGIDEGILTALVGNKLYGLQIIDAFNQVSNGTRTISVGTLYPVLARLEKQGLISSELHDGSTLSKGGARRKFYELTETGTYVLSENQRFRNELYQWKPGYGESAYA